MSKDSITDPDSEKALGGFEIVSEDFASGSEILFGEDSDTGVFPEIVSDSFSLETPAERSTNAIVESIIEDANSKKHSNKGDKNKAQRKALADSMKRARNESGEDDVIEIATVSGGSEDFVIIGEKSRISKNFGKIARFTYSTIIIVLLVVVGYNIILYRAVHEPVVGSKFFINGWSIVDRVYQPNMNEIKAGDVLIIVEGGSIESFLTISNYKEYTYESREGSILQVTDANGKETKIQSVDVSFISRPEVASENS